MASYCAADPPPATCSSTGGSYYKLRYQFSSGTISFALFFSPSTEASFAPTWNATYAEACAGCGTDPANQDMLALASCVYYNVTGATRNAPKPRQPSCVYYNVTGATRPAPKSLTSPTRTCFPWSAACTITSQVRRNLPLDLNLQAPSGPS